MSTPAFGTPAFVIGPCVAISYDFYFHVVDMPIMDIIIPYYTNNKQAFTQRPNAI